MAQPLEARLGLDINPFTRAMRKVRGEVKTFGSSLKRMGKVAAVGFAAVAVPMTLAIRHAASFEYEMARVSAITGAVDKDLSALTRTAKNMSVSVGKSASEVAQGMVLMGQAGLGAKQVIGALPGVLDLATVGGISLAQSADTAAIAMKVFGKRAKDVTKIADIFAFVQAKANTNVQEMAYAFKFGAPIAAQLGMEIEEVAAAIGIMADAGLKGSLGGTALRGGMMRLLNPSKDVKSILKALGIEVVDQAGKFKSLAGILEQFEKVQLVATDRAKIMGAVFGRRAAGGMLALMNATKRVNGATVRGSELLRDFTQRTRESDGFSKKAAATIRDTLVGAWGKLSASIGKLAIVFVEKFQKPLNKFIDKTLKPWILEEANLIEKNAILERSFESFFKTMTAVTKDIKGIWDALRPGIAATIKELFRVNTGIRPVFKALHSYAKEIGPKLPKIVGDAAKAVSEFVEESKAGWRIVGELTAGWSKLRETIEGNNSALGDGVKAIGWFLDKTRLGVEIMATWGGKAWSWMEVNVPAAQQSLDDYFVRAGEKLGKWGSSMKKKVKVVFTDISKFVGDGFAGMIERVESSISTAWAKVKQWIHRIKSSIQSIKIFGIGRKAVSGYPKPLAGHTGAAQAGSTVTATNPMAGVPVPDEGVMRQGGKKTGLAWSDGLKEGIANAATFGLYGGLKAIADMLIGKSPPPKGPLRMIDMGGYNTAKAWGDSFVKALEKVEGPAASIATSLSVALSTGNREWFEGLSENLSMTRDQWQEILEEISVSSTDFHAIFQTQMLDMTLSFQESGLLWSETFKGFFGMLETGMADTVNSVLFGGQKINKIWGNVAKNMAKNLIATFIKIQMQQVLSAMFGAKIAKGAAKTKIGVSAAAAKAGAIAFASTHMPVPAAIGAGNAAYGAAMSAMGNVAAASMGGSLIGGLKMGDTGGGGGAYNLSASPAPAGGGAYQLPGMAEGGIIEKPTVVLAGEAGREAIVPLDREGAGGLGGTLSVNVTVNVPESSMIVGDDLGIAIAEKLTELVTRLDVDLFSSRSKLAEEVEFMA